jgi:hypothetical protein
MHEDILMLFVYVGQRTDYFFSKVLQYQSLQFWVYMSIGVRRLYGKV